MLARAELAPPNSSTLCGLRRPYLDASRLVHRGGRSAGRTGEDIDARGGVDILEARGQDGRFRLCFQQSTGNSASPEGDVLLGRLRDRSADDDVGDLDTAARFEHPVDLAPTLGLVGREVDDAVR